MAEHQMQAHQQVSSGNTVAVVVAMEVAVLAAEVDTRTGTPNGQGIRQGG
jgi:hypothetical protein